MQIQISFQVVLNTGVGQNLCLKEIYQNSFLDKLHQMKNSEGNLWRLNLSLPESDEAMDFKFKLVKRNLSGKIVEEESITRTTILKKGVRHFDLFWNQQYMNELNGLIGTLNKSELMVVTNDKSSSHSLVMSILKHANDLIPNKQDHLNCRLLKSSSKSSKKSSNLLPPKIEKDSKYLKSVLIGESSMIPKEDLLRKSLEKIAGESQKLGKEDLQDLKDSLIDYYKTLLEVASPGMNSSYFQKAKPTTNNENDEINEEFYASGCRLNYHLLSVSKSPQDVQKNSKEALDLVNRYGHKLEPHPLYKLYKVKPTQSELNKSTMIKSNKLTDGKSSKIIKIIDKVVQNSGAELVLTDEETSKEFDCLHILATGGLCNQLVMVSFSDMDEKDFKEMTTSAKYAKQVYIRVRKTLVLSNRFQMNKESDIKVLAFECEPKLTAVISAANLFPNDPSVFKNVKGCKITTCPAIDHLSLNPNQFDSRYDFEWGLSWAPEFEGRGGLDYYFPIGWKGYALKVLGKYDDGRDDWIVKHNASGWAVGYHGVSYDPVQKIQSILNSKLRPGLGQVYQSSQDCNPLLSGPQKGRVVGKGIYLSQKIELPERSYSTPLEVDGKKYIVLFQCRIKPREIRMPKEVPTYYVVPDGDYIRPYRILVKEVTNKH